MRSTQQSGPIGELSSLEDVVEPQHEGTVDGNGALPVRPFGASRPQETGGRRVSGAGQHDHGSRADSRGADGAARSDEVRTHPLLQPVWGGDRRGETRTIPPLARGHVPPPVEDNRKTLIISSTTTPSRDEPRWHTEESVVVPVSLDGGGPSLMRPVPGESLEPGMMIDGKYRVVRELGRGGMGIVYLAEDVALRRSVAVKVLLPRGARDPRHAERFRREARMLAAIEDENVVHIHALGDHVGLPYLVMDYVMGDTLATFLGGLQVAYEVIPLDLAYSLGRQICRALSAVHAAGIVHRDVKPGNVMITAGPRAILMDFSLARDTHASFSGNHIVGTPDYVAPEQIRGRPLIGTEGQRSDIYSLGVTLFETLTGQLPFQGPDSTSVLHSHLRQAPPTPSSMRADLPKSFDAVLLRALAKDPAERWPSCDELGEALTVAYRAARGTPRRRILIAADELEHGQALARMVGVWVPGAEVELVSSGAALLSAGRRYMPALVLIDLQHEEAPGPVEICAELRGDPTTARIPVVVLAAGDSGQTMDRRFLRLLGVRAVVHKPVDPVRLAALVRVVVCGDAATALT